MAGGPVGIRTDFWHGKVDLVRLPCRNKYPTTMHTHVFDISTCTIIIHYMRSAVSMNGFR